MKSRQIIWLLLFSTALNLDCLALPNFETTSSDKKIFILIRSEESVLQVEKFKEHISYDLASQNVNAQIQTYKRSEPLPQAKIFRMAYSGNYDLILLIDQVAKYNIDNRVTNKMIQLGGKYRIRSYNLKSSPYTWVDHGNSNCNISVGNSVKQFTKKILTSMDIIPNDVFYASTTPSTSVKDNEYAYQLKLYNRLIKQLANQKLKTESLLKEIKRIEYRLETIKIRETQLVETTN